MDLATGYKGEYREESGEGRTELVSALPPFVQRVVEPRTALDEASELRPKPRILRWGR
jgi:hypothetical protein